MKNFYKIFISLLMFVLFCGASFAERLPVYPEKSAGFNSTDMPATYAYFEDYSKKLFEALNSRKFLWTGSLQGGAGYTIHRDGTITDIKSNQMTKQDVYAISVIKSVPPGPFPKELDNDEVRVVAIFGAYDFDEIKIKYSVYDPKYADRNPEILLYKGTMSIHIDKDSFKIRKRTTPQPKLFNHPLLKYI